MAGDYRGTSNRTPRNGHRIIETSRLFTKRAELAREVVRKKLEMADLALELVALELRVANVSVCIEKRRV